METTCGICSREQLACLQIQERSNFPESVTVTLTQRWLEKIKKADVAERPKAFHYVGLLVNEPPGVRVSAWRSTWRGASRARTCWSLSDLFVRRGVPSYLRSDNGAEFTATKVREWLARVGVKTLFIEPGSPWENGYIESFNGKLRDELLAREQFDTLLEAKVLIERWRCPNTIKDWFPTWGQVIPTLQSYLGESPEAIG